jgi:hypothetical protein
VFGFVAASAARLAGNGGRAATPIPIPFLRSGRRRLPGFYLSAGVEFFSLSFGSRDIGSA